MSPMNRATIFSNGIADFRRVYPIEAGKTRQLAIPVKKDHIGDILASLNVYGPITLKTPPHYTPINEIGGRLQIDPQNTYQDVGRKLVGANVSINAGGNLPNSPQSMKGILVGLNVTESATGGEAVNTYAFVVMTDRGMETIPFSQVQTITFTDEAIQSELKKALQRKIESLKPESTTVSLEVESENGGDCIVHYTVPAAAWKMTYRLRDTGAGLFFDGFAIVDNNTEEDWEDFQIAVVTGEPITFSTDLAQSKIPQRSQVNVVDDQAQGAIEPERGYSRARRMTKSVGPAMMSASECLDDASSLQQMASGEANLDMFYTEEGMEANTEVKEIGDFSVFESKTPISIGAGESTTIPVFNVALKDATTTLFFKGENHPERPFRAISFKNETNHSLGRGVCTVYEKGTYAGSCILPACKSGEKRMLPHALETGVRVRTERIPQQYAVTSIKISKGTAVSKRQQTCRTTYRIENSKNEPFELVLDHNRLAVGCDKKASLKTGNDGGDGGEIATLIQTIEPTESLKMGYRYTITLPANQTVTLAIDERQVVDQTIVLEGSQGWGWIVNNIIQSDLDITDDTIQNCIKAQKDLDAKSQELANLDSKTQVAEQEQKRLIVLIQADKENANYRTRLGETEEEVRKATRETIPALNEEIEKLTEALYDALGKVALDWSPQG